jgi:hypothetical protein
MQKKEKKRTIKVREKHEWFLNEKKKRHFPGVQIRKRRERKKNCDSYAFPDDEDQKSEERAFYGISLNNRDIKQDK